MALDIYNIFTSRIPANISDFDPRKKKLITFLNPHSYTLAVKNAALFERFDWIAPDGILLVTVFNLIKAAAFKIKRFSCDMTSVVPYIFNIAIENSLSVYFLGADEVSLRNTATVLQSSFPDLKVAGYRDGYFLTDLDRKIAIQSILTLNPDMILIGMGAILQEQMAIDLRQAGYTGAIYTCGGFLHQTRQEINFYPRFIDKANLRFFYRIYKDEGFLNRVIKTYPEFCSLMFKHLLKSVSKQNKFVG